MFFHNLSRHTTPCYVSSGVAAGQGDTQNTTAIDTGEDRGAYFLFCLGTVSSGGNGQVKVQMSADNAVSDPYVDIAGSGLLFAAGNTNTGFFVDINRPQRRWLRAVVVRGSGGNTVIASVSCLLYHVGVAPEPITTGAAMTNGVWLANPGPGAA